MSITLIGDIHGEFYKYKTLISKLDESIQLGDFGIGFTRAVTTRNPAYDYNESEERFIYKIEKTNCSMPEQHQFIFGNHDDPALCLKHPNCLGKWGMYKGMFFVSGGLSIDQEYRKEGRDWWREEELTMGEGYGVLEDYENEKPEIVITHDCPLMINRLLYSHIIPSRTAQLFQSMFDVWQPKRWYFGHHHISFATTIGKTNFQCLNCFETVEV